MMICFLTPFAMDVLRAASDSIPALRQADVTVAEVISYGPTPGACGAQVRLSDGQLATLRFTVGDRPQVIEFVQLEKVSP